MFDSPDPQSWPAYDGTTIPAEHIVSGSSEMGKCSLFARMSSTANRLNYTVIWPEGSHVEFSVT